MRGIGMERIRSSRCRVLVQVTETKPNEGNNWISDHVKLS